MSGISSLSGLSSVMQTITQPANTSKLQQSLLEKVDSNGDQSIDKTELSSFLEYVSEKTGATSADVDTVFTSLDTDGDGSISTDELSENADTLIDQLREQLLSAQIGGSDQPPPPPPGSPPEEAQGEGNPLDNLLADLIEQYQSVSSTTDSTSAVNSLSELA